MGAIVGIYERRDSVSPEASLFAFLNQPDGNGSSDSEIWNNGNLAFGFRSSETASNNSLRLPYYNLDTNLAITADVRLDNSEELRETLGLKQRKPTTDIDLILLSWQKWGVDCPKHLIGDYAFAIWDGRKRSVFCVRDHIGVRPLYYSLTSNRFVFANNIRELTSAPGVSDCLDEEYVLGALADGNFYSDDRTYIKSICKLKPGYSLLVTSDRSDSSDIGIRKSQRRYALQLINHILKPRAKYLRDLFMTEWKQRLR